MIFKKRPVPYELDDPRTTVWHRDIILSTPFLKKVYIYWYQYFVEVYTQNPEGTYLELGSGGGFLKDILPSVITSDIQPLPYVDMQIDAQSLPFDDNSIDGIFMLNVFHHIPKPYLFLKEAQRCLKPNGKIVMIEPANTFISRIIYKKLHHEPFDENGELEIESGKPLSHSNQALPYIYFIREKEWTAQQFSYLKIDDIKYHTALIYLLSGGMSYYPVVPSFSFPLFYGIERLLSVFYKKIALFCTVKILKQV